MSIQPLAFVFSEREVRALCVHESVTMELSCPRASQESYTLTLKGMSSCCYPGLSTDLLQYPLANQRQAIGRKISPPRRHARSLQGVARPSHLQQSSGESSGAVPTVLVGVVMGVVGLLALVLVLAMCGGGADTYTPGQETSSKR